MKCSSWWQLWEDRVLSPAALWEDSVLSPCPVRGQSSVSCCPVRGVRDRPPPSTCCGPGTGLTRWAAGLGRNMLIRVDVIQVITSVRPHHCCSSHHQTYLLESFLPMWCSEEVNRTWSTGVHLYFLPVFFSISKLGREFSQFEDKGGVIQEVHLRDGWPHYCQYSTLSFTTLSLQSI